MVALVPWIFASGPDAQAQQARTPNVVGLHEAMARNAIQRAGLTHRMIRICCQPGHSLEAEDYRHLMKDDNAVDKHGKIQDRSRFPELGVKTEHNDGNRDEGELPGNEMVAIIINKPSHDGIHFVTATGKNDPGECRIKCIQCQ